MKLQKLGKKTSIEIQNISSRGIWLLVGEKEYFLNYKDFHWFQNATVKQICNIVFEHGYHLHWPDLDVDLDINSLEVESVLRRKLNQKQITKQEYDSSQGLWSDFQETINFIPLDIRVVRNGTRLQKIYGLLSGDAAQLGSASLLQIEFTSVRFVCLDQSLIRYAKQEGFL
jgi:predicted nucleic acid-binding protein